MTAHSPKKAILIAAGRGRRLGTHTDAIPKCMVPVGGKPMLAWQWQAMAAAGVEELVIIRGYRGDVLEQFARTIVPRVRFIDNHEWESNNVLLSLACAYAELNEPVLISYSDIIYTPAIATAVAQSSGDVALVIDRDFRSIYVGRTEHQLDEGEVADLRSDGAVHRVGKRALSPADAIGEFIGLCKLSATGAAWFTMALDELTKTFRARQDEPFQRAARFRNAYLTDLLQHLIDGGHAVSPVLIDGNWREIDTGQDLASAEVLLQSRPEVWR